MLLFFGLAKLWSFINNTSNDGVLCVAFVAVPLRKSLNPRRSRRTVRFLRQPDTVTRLGDFLKAELAAQRWREFRAAVAFAKRSGVEQLADELAMFASRGSIRISIGVDLHGTSKEGLQALLDAVTAHGGQVWIFHNEEPLQPTFHPKVYVFKEPHAALVIIGSGNLTAGGLFTNYEAGAIFELDLDKDADDALLREIEA